MPLHTCSKDEQRAVIGFLGSEGEKPINVHRRVQKQYGKVPYYCNKCMNATGNSKVL